MPADLLPDEDIKRIAEQLNATELGVLRDVRKVGSIRYSGRLDRETVELLQRLAKRGLVDPGYSGPTDGPPFLWLINSNGERALKYRTGLRAGPHYEIPSPELALWLERQGMERWWNVDGDPFLAGRLTFPCPAEELAAELRRINRPLLVQSQGSDIEAQGQVIDATALEKAVGRFPTNRPASEAAPGWGGDRFLYLCWKRSAHEWLLAEDLVTTEQNRADEEAQPK